MAEEVGGCGAGVVTVPSSRSDPGTLPRRYAYWYAGRLSLPLLERKWKCVPLLGAGKSAQGVSPPSSDGGEHRRCGGVAAESREELLLALRVGVARRLRQSVAVGEAAQRQRIRQSRSDCASPADAPRRSGSPRSRRASDDRLVVRPQVEDSPAALWSVVGSSMSRAPSASSGGRSSASWATDSPRMACPWTHERCSP